MRKVTSTFRRRLAAGASLLLLILATAAIFHRHFRPNPSSVRVAAAAAKSADGVSSQSLYQLESVWTTDHDKTLRLAELQGRYTILSLIFTRCSGTCPLLVKELQEFGASLPPDIRNETRFVAITIDPADTSGTLLQYRHEMRLDEQQWMLLRGAPMAVREIAAVLGFNYTQTGEQADDSQFSHSNLLTLLNPRGEIILQQQGSGGNFRDLIAALRHTT
jgi:protein SCO1/2